MQGEAGRFTLNITYKAPVHNLIPIQMFMENAYILLVPWTNLWVAVSGYCYTHDYKHSYCHVHTCKYHFCNCTDTHTCAYTHTSVSMCTKLPVDKDQSMHPVKWSFHASACVEM